jgi:hypothetical protein
MELGGLEPPTSWVRSTSPGREFGVRSGAFAGIYQVAVDAESGADIRRFVGIPVDSGTLWRQVPDRQRRRVGSVDAVGADGFSVPEPDELVVKGYVDGLADAGYLGLVEE